MPPKKKNNGKRGENVSLPSKFKQDIIGILLIAVAVFVFIANNSSLTGLIGVFIVNKALRSIIGIGVLWLPFFIGIYGLIMLLRHEVKELQVRLTGLFLMFLTFITVAQYLYPQYYVGSLKYEVAQGAGGAIGYAVKSFLENTVGLAGSTVLLIALSFISILLVLNVTFHSLVALIVSLFKLEKIESTKKQVAAQDQAAKMVAQYEKEAVSTQQAQPMPMPAAEEPARQAVIEFPLPRFEADADAPASKVKIITADSQGQSYSKYKLPPLDLLDDTPAKERQQAERLKETTELRRKLLEEALRSFGVGAHVVSIFQGPAVTRYELQPEPGVKVSRIANLADDIALNLAAQGVRIEAPVPGKSVVGIEVPNATISPVRLKEIVKTNEFKNNSSKLIVALGKDLAGAPIYGDLGKMPHLLIAGTTGSGKSVCINSLITSILLRARPDEVKMLMIDPKMVELSIYDGIAHLLAPVVTDARRASATLREWVIKEMERRYKAFHETGARNIQAYNHKLKDDEAPLPYIIVIIDELADLMMIAANEVETSICRIAQLARATGIHLVIATQRPSVDVITGLIKANIPSRIAFAVATQIDSRVILDSSGAEKLLGRGDMLYNPIGAMKPTRAQGSFVSDKETEKIIKFVKDQAEPEYLEEIIGIKAIDFGKDKGNGERETGGQDALFAEVAELVTQSGQASTSFVQRKFRIGYNRAARLMDELQEAGIVSAPEGELKTRKILTPRIPQPNVS